MNRSRRLTATLYIVTMVFAFNNVYGDYKYPLMAQIGVAFLWVFYGILNYSMGTHRSEASRKCILLLKIYLTGDIVIHMYTILLICFGVVDSEFFSTNISTYVPTLLAIFSLYLFKDKALLYNCISLIISWFLSIFISMAQHGISIIKDAIIQGYIDSRYSVAGVRVANRFELHDLVLAVWYLLLYFIYCRKDFSKKQKRVLLLFVIIGLLGFKRAALIGVLVSLVFHIFVYRFNNTNRGRVCLLTGWIMLATSIIFVYFIYGNGLFFIIVNNFKIDFMGRLWIWQQLAPYVEVSPSFLGLGRNVIANWFSGETDYLLHSDILKMFAENGIYLFIFWLLYIFVHIPKKYKQVFGNEALTVYMGLMIYTFFLYLTDNTENYFACKTLSILIPSYHALYGEMFRQKIKIFGQAWIKDKTKESIRETVIG